MSNVQKEIRLGSPIFSGLLFAFMAFFGASSGTFASENEKSVNFDHAHSTWNEILKKYVLVEGPQSNVDYRSLKKSSSGLDSYLAQLETVSGDQFKKFASNDQIAFLINAYNALTIKLVLDHYPVSSIKKVGGLFSSPWKKRFFKILGNEHSLDDIEHEMLRKQYSEPRIHFALVCASKSCPSLRNEPYVGKQLNVQLDDAARVFLADTSRNRYDPSNKTLYVSSIFKWYGEDFVKKSGSIEAYLLPFFSKNSAANLKASEISIKYLDYDWSLNEKAP